MNAKQYKGNCAIGGKFGKLSFEHVPPQAAFNDRPIFIQTHTHLVEQNSPLFGKRMKSNKGLRGYTLCESCSNLTGDWYARDFAEFAQQGMQIISNLFTLQPFVSGEYLIKPLNVFKQILVMFMSADKSGHLQSQQGLTSFILNKENILFPKEYRLFLYSNLSPQKRMMGYSVVYDPGLGIQKWSEINFKPFGYFLAEDSNPAHPDMLDVTSFSTFPFDESVRLNMTTRYLNINGPFIGMYQ